MSLRQLPVLQHETALAWIGFHIMCFEAQRVAFSERDNLTATQILLLGDFGTFPIQLAAGDGPDGATKLPDFVLTAFMRGHNHDIKHCFMDCVLLINQNKKIQSKSRCET